MLAAGCAVIATGERADAPLVESSSSSMITIATFFAAAASTEGRAGAALGPARAARKAFGQLKAGEVRLSVGRARHPEPEGANRVVELAVPRLAFQARAAVD